MRKKVLIHGGIGFLVGMVLVMLIPAISNLAEDGTARLVSSSLIARVGSAQAAFVMSLLMYGLYGSCCLGGMLLYEIERHCAGLLARLPAPLLGADMEGTTVHRGADGRRLCSDLARAVSALQGGGAGTESSE